MKQLRNKSISKICNFFTVICILLLINSCAYFKLKDLDKYNFSNDAIFDLISKEYKDFASFELYEMHDEIDANYFAFKALEILKNKEIKIENPNKWNIPDNMRKEALEEYNKLNILLKKQVIFTYPKLTAKLVSGFDCWIEQIEENWQTEDISNCKIKFTKSYDTLINYSLNENNLEIKKTEKVHNETIDSNKKSNKLTSITEETESRVIVYFAYDSYNVSYNENNKLDEFINKIRNNNKPIVVYGHTDTKGPKSYNLELSIKRAKEVMTYLKSKKIKNKIFVKGYGESFPLVDTGDEITEKKNRRAEIIINH